MLELITSEIAKISCKILLALGQDQKTGFSQITCFGSGDLRKFAVIGGGSMQILKYPRHPA